MSKSKNRKFIVAVDFDGTLAEPGLWKGNLTEPGKPIQPMVDLVRSLFSEGFAIVIWTCRDHDPVVAAWCHKYDVPFDGINKNLLSEYSQCSRKIFADAYVDDKAAGVDISDTKRILEDIRSRREGWLKSDEL